VAHVRCDGLVGPEGFARRGWVTVRVVPRGPERMPQPSAELRRRIVRALSLRAPASAGRIRVVAARYLAVSVIADVVPIDPQAAAMVEARLREALDAFLHPVSGGTHGRGWPFGTALHLSSLAALIEHGVEGVDHALHLRMTVDGEMFAEHVPVPPDGVIAPGDHEIKLTMEAR
jgi:hypothetical protein